LDVFFFIATTYSLLPVKAMKLAIINVGTVMKKKFDANISGYYKTLSMD
jgi:hypothetical protein